MGADGSSGDDDDGYVPTSADGGRRVVGGGTRGGAWISSRNGHRNSMEGLEGVMEGRRRLRRPMQTRTEERAGGKIIPDPPPLHRRCRSSQVDGHGDDDDDACALSPARHAHARYLVVVPDRPL